jgi:exosortase
MPFNASPGLGWIILCGGLALLLLGGAGHLLVMQEMSLLVTITGLVLLFLGAEALCVLWVPIAYLLFMIPIWGIITDPLQMPSRLFSASLAALILKSAGFSLFHHGIYIELPNVTLEVARECSGVNYLFAVAAIGVPIALLFLDGWRTRAILLGSALMISMLANSVRIAFIGVVATYNLSVDSHGPLHVLQGLFVSAVGFMAIFAVLWLLRRGTSPSPT